MHSRVRTHAHTLFQVFSETTSHSTLCSHINVLRSAGAMRIESSIFFRFAYYDDMTVIVISYYFLSSIVCVCVLFYFFVRLDCSYLSMSRSPFWVFSCFKNHMRTLFSPFVLRIFFVDDDVILSHALLFFFMHAYASPPTPPPPSSTWSSLYFHIFQNTLRPTKKKIRKRIEKGVWKCHHSTPAPPVAEEEKPLLLFYYSSLHPWNIPFSKVEKMPCRVVLKHIPKRTQTILDAHNNENNQKKLPKNKMKCVIISGGCRLERCARATPFDIPEPTAHRMVRAWKP